MFIKNWIYMGLMGVILASANMAVLANDWNAETHVAHAGSFNGDGCLDLFLQTRSPEYLNVILPGDCTGNFGKALQSWPQHHFGLDWDADQSDVVVADFNGDGRSDLLLRQKMKINGVKINGVRLEWHLLKHKQLNY